LILLSFSISDEKRLQHQLDQCLAANDAIELYLVVLDYVREELETTEQTKGSMKKVAFHFSTGFSAVLN